MTELSHPRLRGALAGPALFLLLSPQEALPAEPVVTSEAYYLLVRRLLRHENYLLIEPAGGAGVPRILFLDDRDQANPHPPRLTEVEQAVLDLSHSDADIREEAVLTLADSEDTSLRAYLFLALEDPDDGVRDAAAAALDDE